MIDQEMVESIRSKPAHAHRHGYEEIFILSEGNPSHMIDFRSIQTATPVVMYVAQGKVHEFLPDPETRGWCIRYRNDFIPESNFHFYSNYLDRILFSYTPDTCREEIGTLLNLIHSTFTRHPERPNVYRHLFLALLARLEAEGDHHLPPRQNSRTSAYEAFRTFLSILEDNFRRNEGVGFYAGKMNTSVRNLNHLCSKVFGQSVSEIIETRKMIEARRLLLGTGLTVAEIGFSIGYNEKSYFTRVFRKRTGLTPTDFRSSVGS